METWEGLMGPSVGCEISHPWWCYQVKVAMRCSPQAWKYIMICVVSNE